MSHASHDSTFICECAKLFFFLNCKLRVLAQRVFLLLLYLGLTVPSVFQHLSATPILRALREKDKGDDPEEPL